MALKQLMINKKIEQRQKLLKSLNEKRTGFKTRDDSLEKALTEADTEDEIAAVEDEINQLEKEKTAAEDEATKLEEQITELEDELAALEDNEPSSEDPAEPTNEGGTRSMKKGAFQKRTRDLGETYFTREVLDFYKELRTKLTQKRANGNVLPEGEGRNELAIPDLIMNRIRERIGDFTTLYPLVDVVVAQGRLKLILDVDTQEATWMEQRNVSLPEKDDSELTAVEFDGFLIGRIVYIDNSLLEDSQPIINLDEYLTTRIARSIAKGIDKAIAVGTGATDKQPEGILPAIPAENKVTAKANYADIIPHLALIDTGEDATGEIILVMHRQTYYRRLAALTLHVNSAGQDVVQLPNLAQPNFLGLRVEFNNYIPQNKLLLGVFDKYTLVERASTRIDASTDYRFREYQTAIRGVGRYDGKPVIPKAFVEVTLEDDVVVPKV